MLSSHVLWLQFGHLKKPTKILCAVCVCHRLIVLTILWYLHSPWSSSLHNMLYYPVALAFVGSNIFLSNWFSDICNLCFTCKIRNYVSQPYEMTGSVHRLLLWESRISYLPKCKMNPYLQSSVFRTIPKFTLARFCMLLMHAWEYGITYSSKVKYWSKITSTSVTLLSLEEFP